VRVRHLISRCGWVVVGSAVLVLPSSGTALAQLQITPETSITPSSHVTSWIFQMAVASVVLAVLVLIGFTLAYLRFAPKFSGREGKTAPLPPGSRPATLTSQAAAIRWTPPTTPSGSHAAAAPAGRGTATAVAEGPAPSPAATPAEVEVSSEGAAAAAEASVRPTAGPSGEPAVQADAVGEAEAAAPEARPSAKTAEEVGADSTPAPAQPVPPQPAPAQASHGAGLDQATFDRVLEEQLAKGVDRRVAEGRARAAAVVAARKKAQG
jgi:hypothetical protein